MLLQAYFNQKRLANEALASLATRYVIYVAISRLEALTKME